MSFHLFLIFFITIYCSDKKEELNEGKEKKFINNSTENNINNLFKNDYSKINQKRELENYQTIRINLITTRLEAFYEYEGKMEVFEIIKNALNQAKEVLQKLIKVKPINRIIIPEDIINQIKTDGFLRNNEVIPNEYETDLVIFIRAKTALENIDSNCFSIPKIYLQEDNNGRPIVGGVTYNYGYRIPDDKNLKIQTLKLIFLHEFTHILGFEQTILNNKNFIEEKVSERIEDKSIIKKVINSKNVLSRAKKYFNCSSIEGIELDTKISLEGDKFIHWEGRLLLGEYMTSELYYPEQVISEFTLALLEDLGWYQVNYYTGGLMKFGKNKGCDFINKDCVIINEGIISSRFPNEFCSPNVFGTCSVGRQSRGYCYTETTGNFASSKGYKRNGWENEYGIGIAEYCPVTLENKLSGDSPFYIGNCKYGNNDYGNEIKLENGQSYSYNGLTDYFAEKYGIDSFCALSSIIKKNSNVGEYKSYIRPTCYSMFCSDKSLTIQLEEEYIVCPRQGGMIKIEDKTYSNYVGYLFCPDYNLICTGTKICNDLFDCVDEESISKDPLYDYDNINDITSQITSDITTENKLNDDKLIEGYELSDKEDTKCPINCRQCISNKRCTLCRTFNQDEPHAYYIGSKDDGEHNINCADKKPLKGYYEISRDDHLHYFKCVDGCDKCENANECEQCSPSHYINRDDKNCIERIPHCKKYDELSKFIDYDNNNGGEGYRKCENCNNEEGYYCVNMDKTKCINDDNYKKEIYYKMEDREYSCVGLCDDKFLNCIKCTKDNCNKCSPKYYINKEKNGCIERIPHCEIYDEDSKYTDNDNNGGGEGYKDCEKCFDDYYCIQNNKSICQYISGEEIDTYYNYGNGCKDLCSNKYPYCETCDENKCITCLTHMKSDGTCVEGIKNCKKYNKETANETYVECSQCDNENGYFCINMTKTSCNKINMEEKIYYYDMEQNTNYPCIRKCEHEYQECSQCNNTHCLICKERHILSLDETRCLFTFDPLPDDECRIEIHEIDFNIEDLDFMYFIDYYFDNTFAYLKTVDHFVNENYTVTMFIHSECTEDLINLGYFKIDSEELYKEMVKQSKTETNEFLISLFIVYNNKNHFRFHNIYSLYLEPEKICESCLDVPFTITNNYNDSLNNVLGPFLSNLIASEDIDIFTKDSKIFIDSCTNVTLNGIDIPINERYKYLYLKEKTNNIACTGSNCELVEVNTKEYTSVCKCKIGNTFEDILRNETEIDNSQDNTTYESYSSSTFSSLKCAKNGFNSKNIKENGGFFIALIVLVAQVGLCLVYFLFTKTLTIPKVSNPPAKIKNNLRLVSNWGQENTKKKMRDNEEMCEFQPRDDKEEELFEEVESYTNNVDLIFSYSMNSSGVGRIDNEKTKDGKKVLVLIKKKGANDDASEQEYLSLNKSKRRTFCQIYWSVLSIKQHIINYFSSSISCCNIIESYVPLPIRLIRSLLMVVLSFLLNSLFLGTKYFSEKFKYFNEKYKLIAVTSDEMDISPDEIDSNVKIPSSEKTSYAFTHTIIYAVIVFAILLIIQLILGLVFFSLRKSVREAVKKNDSSEIKELESQIKIKYIVFFAINFVFMIIFLFTFVGFGGIYGGAFFDYFVPGIISIIFLEIFPFLWSLILALIKYLGIKYKIKICFKISQFFMF